MGYTQAKIGTTVLAVGVTVNAQVARANSFAQSSQSVTNFIRLCPLPHKSLKRNWREVVMFAIGWHQTLFYSAMEAQAYATERNLVVYTWQCFEKQNWLRRGATNVDAFCYTVLPTDAPESVRLADDDGDAFAYAPG